MKKAIISILILIITTLIYNNIKPFRDDITGFSGVVVFLDSRIYETGARLAQVLKMDDNGALKDYKIPFIKKCFLVFETN